MFGPVTLLFCCDLVVTESKKLLSTCYKLQIYLPADSKEGKQLARLENLIRSKPPVFTAAGFFPVNRTTLLYLVNTITTYFIVAIQFRDK
ncbi:hypothetical protein NQ318_000437 [Aromia moschata]|uniref:Gustatory receptor n=1 Tax=Aromia moschata TaxID=1265417 RepID=A0AAV8YV59_9CUCU|nr:hypothetical protein NQ318_000437 [Aromia moschata]